MHLLALAACVVGFALLALAMQRHQTEVLGRALRPRSCQALRGLGASALALAWWLAWDVWGGALGSVVFWAHAMLAAGVVYGGLIVLRRR